jgi:hypothetical protein
MEVFDELLENEDLEVEDYKVAIERLREEALEAQEAVVGESYSRIYDAESR